MALSAGDYAAIGIGLGNIAAWSKVIYEARKNNRNGNGNGKVCPLPAVESRIATVESEKDGLSEEMRSLHAENRQDHQKMADDIKSLAVAVASAEALTRRALGGSGGACGG